MINLLTHYDLDGVVCYILLRSFIPRINCKPIGYDKLSDNIYQFIAMHSKSIITDLSLSQGDIDLIKRFNNNTLLIDHHETSLPFKDQETEKFKVYINTKYCGAANVLKYFKGKQKFSESLKTLTYLTNDYDLWIHKEPESKILNYIFWQRGFNAFAEMFKNGYDEKIVQSFRAGYQREQDKKLEHLNNCEKYEFEENGKKLLLIFCLIGYTNDVSLTFPDYDYHVIISSQHKISVRCNNNHSLVEPFNTFKDTEWVDNIGCHKHAGGITFKTDLKEDDLQEAYEVLCGLLLKGF